MKSIVLLASALLAGSVISAPTANIPKFTQDELDSGKAIRELGRIAYDNAMARASKATTGCTKDKVRIRKEW
jgi:tyrosinase